KTACTGKAHPANGADFRIAACAERTRSDHGAFGRAYRVGHWGDSGSELEVSGLHFRSAPSGASFLSRNSRNSQNPTQPPNRSSAEIVNFGALAPQGSTKHGKPGQRFGVSYSQWHPIQRHQSAAPTVETG